MRYNKATTIDPAEKARFEKHAKVWWNTEGPFWPLHRMNQLRTELIVNEVLKAFSERTPERIHPLSGLKVLDIGCGGGILSEAMARLGAEVTGIDIVEKNVGIASTHAEEQGLGIHYRCMAVEDLVKEGSRFDLVLNMEVVEHVQKLPLFLQCASELVRPGGLMVVATLNRTVLSYLMAIIGAEYVLKWLPKGTHQWRKFVKPEEVSAQLGPWGLERTGVRGIWLNPFKKTFRTIPWTWVNYISYFQKEDGVPGQ